MCLKMTLDADDVGQMMSNKIFSFYPILVFVIVDGD